MEYFFQYLANSLIGYSLELIAALAGIYYLNKKVSLKKSDYFLVYFLWFTFFIEVIGIYAPVAYFSKYEYFGFIKDSVFENNIWLYNIYLLASYSFFIYYFRSFLHKAKEKKVLKISTFLFLVLGSINLLYSGVFFKDYSLFSTIIGSLLVLISVILFYFNILKSDKIINLKKHLPIYISIGVLVFNLSITPLDIFSKYFSEENRLFIEIKTNILIFANIFMYTAFIIGFLVCAKKKTKLKPL